MRENSHRLGRWDRLKTFWRRQLLPKWRGYRWGMIGVLWLSTLYLGYVGFASHFAAIGSIASPWDIFYLDLQLFVLESGAVSGPKAWELEVARLLAPAVTGYTALQALAAIFYEQLQSLRLRHTRDHVVVSGLGRKGFLLVRGFLERGDSVIVIERDEGNDLIGQCRELGAVVLIGDATVMERLRKAAVHKAKYLVSVCGDDETNAEVAAHARELVGGREGGALTCFVHLVDPRLCSLLREREIATRVARPFRLEFFNVFESGARALFDQYRPFSEDATDGCSPHLLVIGLGNMGESLVVHAVRAWRSMSSIMGERLRITVIDKEAEWKAESLKARYPHLAKACDLSMLQADVCRSEFQRAEFLFDRSGHCDVTAIYVCLDNNSLGLAAGLALLQRVREERIPIVVRMAYDAGLAAFLRGTADSDGSFASLHTFGLLDQTCRPDLLLGGSHETIARAIHEDYVRQQEKRGDTVESNPSLVPWERLPEGLKESNRHQADFLAVKLKAVGCSIAPLTDWDAESFTFTAQEIEKMAEIEHDRWVEERRQARWAYAPGPKNLEKKTSPDLLLWTELSEPVKEKDRDTVRSLPAFLAKAGFQIYREGLSEGLSKASPQPQA